MEELFFQKESTLGRDIEKVSHFFLTDRDSREVLPQYSCPVEGPAKENEEKTIPDTNPEGCIVLCPEGFLTRGSVLGCMLALSLAASGISVGLIETTARLPHTFFLSGGYENLDAVFWESGIDSPDFFNVVSRFRETCDFIFINAAASAMSKISGPTGFIGRCIVPATTRPQDLLSAYGTMKSISRKWVLSEIELVVIKHPGMDNAARGVTLLEDMARIFRPCPVRFIGAVTLPEDICAFRVFSHAPPPQVLPEAVTAVKEIARHLMLSGGLQEKRKQRLCRKSNNLIS